MAMRCTQWPTSASGRGCTRSAGRWLIGRQVSPPSSVRKAPAAEMAMKMRSGLLGSSRMVCRHMPPAPGCQCGPVPWPRSPDSSLPGLPAVGRAEQRGVLDAGVDGVRIGQRRLEVPDALELPRVRRAVVPLVRAGHAVVGELVADRLPGLAAVVGALDHLAEPAAGLRRVDAGSGRPASPSRGRSPSPPKCGPLDRPIVPRLPSDVRMNAPFLVPTSTLIPLIFGSPPGLARSFDRCARV